jgi:hypothetical protein
VVEYSLSNDPDAARAEYGCDLFLRESRSSADRAAEHASRAPQLVLEGAESREDERHERPRSRRFDVLPRANRDADRGYDPDRRRRCQPGDRSARLHDSPRADETDSGDDLRRQAGWVSDPLRDGRDVNRDVREESGAHADQNVRPQARWFSGDLALEPDCAAEEYGKRELSEEIDSECVYDFGDVRWCYQGEKGGEDRLLPPVETCVAISSRGPGRRRTPSAASRRPARCCALVPRVAR